MNYLIDTNILLWYLESDPRLPDDFKEILFSDQSSIYISIVSLWEITIKTSLGKLQLSNGFENTLSIIESSDQWSILPIKSEHLKKLYSLPYKHHDPFDRLIYAQSLSENMGFLYTDKSFDLYSEK